MENFTALGANEITKNITFQGEMHKKFFLLYLPECRNEDVYHQALIYCLGISRDKIGRASCRERVSSPV